MSDRDKRKRLVDAAYNVFCKKGYTKASIKDIAHEAGITPGLVHYYFRNKEELLLAVQNEVQKQYHSRYDGWRENSVTAAQLMSEIKSRVASNPDWYRWRYEIYSLALKNDRLKQEAASILRSGRDSLSEPLRHLAFNAETADALAGILLACFDGLALQKLLDDQFDLDRAYQVLLELAETFLARGEAE